LQGSRAAPRPFSTISAEADRAMPEPAILSHRMTQEDRSAARPGAALVMAGADSRDPSPTLTRINLFDGRRKESFAKYTRQAVPDRHADATENLKETHHE
jgi:hypothetical protein